MLKPKAYGRGGCYRAAATLRNLHRHLVEVVWHRHTLRVVLCRGVGYRPRLALLCKSYARNDVYLLAFCDALQSPLQRTPNAAVEVVLYLRYRVGNVECLRLQRAVAVARGIWDKVSSRVVVVVATVAEVYLIRCAYQRVVRPVVESREASHMAAIQRISHPHRGICRCVVVGGVVVAYF